MGKILYNLTNPQKSIWDTQEFYPNNPIENITASAIIKDRVNFAYFSDAINIFLQKHDAFRLKFTIQNGEPKQFIETYSPLSFNIITVKNDKDVEILAGKMANTVFDITDTLLCKFQLFRFPDGHGGIVLLVHHLISDAWSCGLFISEIIDIYDALMENKDPEIDSYSYIDYISSENEYFVSPKFEKDKSFWAQKFETIPEIATIPAMLESHKLSSTAKRKTFKIPNDTMNIINEFCKENKISVFNFFMSIYSIYLSKINNLNDFVIGTPVLNRSNVKEKHTIGMFISVVPFRIQIDDNQTFIDFARKVAKDFFDVFRHQKYPYQTLLQDLRKSHNNMPNLYNIMLSYQNMRTNKQTAKTNYEAKWYFCNNISDDIDIHFFDINDTGTIDLAYDYKTSKYSIEDIYALHTRILNIINQILLNPNIKIIDVESLTQDEKNEILYKFNNTKAVYEKQKSIAEIFVEQANKNPDGIAVVYGDKKITYKELNIKSNQFGNYLLELGASKGTIVPVLLNRSIDLIIAMLGIIKIGAVYLPLSTEYPVDRLNYIINNSKAKYIVVDSSNNLFLRDDLINIDMYNFNYNAQYKELCINVPASNILYVIYTSGSTGNPKGVKVTNNNLNNFINSFNSLFSNISSSDHLLASTNICFDVSIFEFYIALLNGCSLYLYEENTITDIFKFCNEIIKNNITMLYIPPNILSDVYDILKEKKYSGINKLLIGVEPIKSSVMANFYKLNPNIKIVNGYGPTETTICASAINVDKSILENYEILPIGKPLLNTTLYVLDKNHKFLPVGTPR